MFRKLPIIGVLLILAMLVLSGCNLPKRNASKSGAQTPTFAAVTALTTPTPVFTPTPEPTLCDNIYQPSRLGDTWVYSGSNTALQNYSRTDNIKNAGYDAFTSENNLAGVTYSVDYACTSEGLVATNPVQQYLGALLASPGSQISVRLNSTSGISLPSDVKPGDEWQQTASVDATINNTSTSGWVVFDYIAQGIESVTVPSGAYDALRVDLTITVQVTPLRLSAGTYQSTIWMAPNVGVIKTEGTSHVTGVDFTDSTQLTSFTSAP